MTIQPFRVRNFNATKHELPSRDQLVNIITNAYMNHTKKVMMHIRICEPNHREAEQSGAQVVGVKASEVLNYGGRYPKKSNCTNSFRREGDHPPITESQSDFEFH